MLDWLREHFSINAWWPTFEPDGDSYAIIAADVSWWPNYIDLRCELLGFGFALGYWPDGKYDDTEGAGA